MPGLVPGIHVCRSASKDVDGRDKPGHDDKEMHYPAALMVERNAQCVKYTST
jgi:hypothetical protein